MGANTKIEWADHSASPWHGCTHATADGIAHPGCEHCYAETMSVRNPGTLGIWGEDGTRVKSKSFINNLRKWNREAKAAGKVVSVFPSLCDPFEDRPELVPWREEMFAVIDECAWVRLLLLTKRPQNVRRMWPHFAILGGVQRFDHFLATGCERVALHADEMPHRSNVWILASVSDQRTADVLVPDLLKLRELVPVLGLSVEPLLGPIDFACARRELSCIDWVIVGGESGPHARPMHPDWPRSIRDQCEAAGVAYFFKQWGEFQNGSALSCPSAAVLNNGRFVFPDTEAGRQSLSRELGHRWNEFNPVTMARVGKAKAGRLLDGREHNAMPEVEVPA